jgi:DNA-binding transcriptional LysR family regulator
LVVRRIGVSRVIIVAAPSYLAAHGASTSPKEIARHRCVGIAAPLPWNEIWRVGGEEVAIRPVLLVNTGEALRVAVITGVGIVPVPDWVVADALAAGQLIRVLGEFETPSSGIYAVYPTNRLLTPVVRVFVDHLAKGLSARGLQP